MSHKHCFYVRKGKACGKLVQNHKPRVPVAGRSMGWLPQESFLALAVPCLPRWSPSQPFLTILAGVPASVRGVATGTLSTARGLIST